jgi:hypothetical protein
LELHVRGPTVVSAGPPPPPKDIRQDCAQAGEEAQWRSFYLVWKPSSQEVPGPSCVLSAPSPKQWDAIGYHVYQTSSYWLLQRSNLFTILFSLLCGQWKTLFVSLSSSTFSRTVFLYNVFGSPPPQLIAPIIHLQYGQNCNKNCPRSSWDIDTTTS